MGRFSFDEADNYGSAGTSSYFSLQDDGDVAKVRILYESMEDVEGYAVHEIELNGKKRYVNCLRAYNEPKNMCPFCDANNFQKAKLFIPLLDIESGEVKMWERGKKFFQKISSLCSRYSNSTTPLCAHTFEVERCGKKGDNGTTYEFYETGSDNKRLEDFPEIPDVIGTIILDKTADEMETFLDTGDFPSDNAPAERRRASEGVPERRRRDDEDRGARRDEDERPTGRRTPATSRRGDNF